MNSTEKNIERVAKMSFASIYPLYISKIQKKNRTSEELNQVITWLTGYSVKELQKHLDNKTTFQEFFQQAKINPNASKITGTICGYKIEEIENPFMKKVRYLDKLVDELAKGHPLTKILRS
ncbi:MAG TPA: DUF2200 domain-containing protein [Bacteroidia bacterium]|nr:DUF2200 domain-containing protein [Bacteroidia bacterium]QQR96072.1 MAG: DUF2200 domain-containing protein [Bacteroidota bacterium]MBP7713664.1 DUF2200 domain-containing protein [Bacteroidia bacterium]MBP8667469.1 DUF2200 domain-containing protein [Bacteroidia bacterium]HOZ82475.1 DUF2200 domain-containing protein [Bacteroidia bacterium]